MHALAVLDDKVARNVAKRLGVNCFGTLKLLEDIQDAVILTTDQFYEFLGK
jgi:predicted nucleic acid-binding protein